MNSLYLLIIPIIYTLKRLYDYGFNRGYVYYEIEIKREVAELMKKFEEE